MSSARLVVLEGVDDVGKTTLTAATQQALLASGLKTASFSFPGKTKGGIGEFVYQLIEQPNRCSSAALQVMHVAAHVDQIQRAILPAVACCDVVLLDRFYWSTLAYGECSGVHLDMLESLVDCELVTWGGVEPDVVFLIGRAEAVQVADRRLVEAYERVSTRFSTKYPVVRVENAGTIQQGVDVIIRWLL